MFFSMLKLITGAILIFISTLGLLVGFHDWVFLSISLVLFFFGLWLYHTPLSVSASPAELLKPRYIRTARTRNRRLHYYR